VVKSPIQTIVPALSGLLLAGCFSARTTTPGEISAGARPAAVRIETRDGREFRALVDPSGIGPETIRFSSLRYGPSSWVVRFAGWPATWSAGKYWRNDIDGDVMEIPIADVRSLQVERTSWWRTILSSPLTFPPGLIDFLVRTVELGFDQNDDRFDSFAPPPESRRLSEPEVPPPAAGDPAAAPPPAPPE
jgi:hypothetical protein